jgi:hypothetical protein
MFEALTALLAFPTIWALLMTSSIWLGNRTWNKGKSGSHSSTAQLAEFYAMAVIMLVPAIFISALLYAKI